MSQTAATVIMHESELDIYLTNLGGTADITSRP